MTANAELSVTRWLGDSPRINDELAALLTAYHLQTEAEKGYPVADADALPDRYRAEITHPQTAFDDDVVLMASLGDTVAGCLVVTSSTTRIVEIKRLWTDPAHRGRGVAASLLDAAVEHAARVDADVVRLSVWAWRDAAIGLYEKHGFSVTESWDERDQLVCMSRTV